MLGKTSIAVILLVFFLFFFGVYLFLQPRHLYDLSHASLHPPLPAHRHDDLPVTMWQNLGYWAEQLPAGKVSNREFPKACSALLEKVVTTAGWDEMPSIPFVVELGFGCGDSAWEIFHGKGAEIVKGKKRWDVKHYIGITNNRDQLALTKGRYIEDFGDNVRFEFGNGGIPESWKKDTHDIVGSGKGDGWILAIDTLYHMDRERLFGFVPSTWNIAACDLLLSDSASGWRLRLMEKLAPVFGIRPENLLTRDEYIALLVAGGWDLADITIEDISPNVFSPLSVYLKERPQLKWKIVGLLFGLLGSWGGVRACVVVAKENKKKADKVY
ncbi:hypothetical protein BJ508DRAFT_71641 [Ascobolus immersus RN42]|uniref:S-adenosyl-L-methionine-dependent methyltransferase n=1 Tax=Ascobolus immersus RN42 TaxID=1160509 RepID=A0A3N4IP37_ASCIM|nr:hypothetical protein BJ508DRAFT_71641 [Ascobolus immersus RN42]